MSALSSILEHLRIAGLLAALALGQLLVPGPAWCAPLQVQGQHVVDAHGNVLQLRGVNLPVYKSGYADDLDAVAAALARTQANAVRLVWWANPPPGATAFTVANLDRALQKFRDLGLISVLELHDLTFQYGHDAKTGTLSDGNDAQRFADVITAYWTRSDVMAVLRKHQDHLILNLANEWGSSYYADGSPATSNFLQNYAQAMQAIRAAGLASPLMVDAPKGFEYSFLLAHGQALRQADPWQQVVLSVHTYWAASGYTDTQVQEIVDALVNTGLPVVLGEVSSQAWTTTPCDPVHYAPLLTRANNRLAGYFFWAWYEDGQCGQWMNITRGSQGDGVTLPTAAQPGFGYDALFHPDFGIDSAQPATRKADFSPLPAASLVEASLSYPVTSTDDGQTRESLALLTRRDDIGADRRPVIVFLPGWAGVGDVAPARHAQALDFASQGYIAVNLGLHPTSSGPWYSDLAENTLAALDRVCIQTYADCRGIVLAGSSYGGTQAHPVLRYLRSQGRYDGSAGGNQGYKVVGFLAQDAGYTTYWSTPADADATAYSVAMIENLGDTTFPVDTCDFGNCGARNRAEYHQLAPGSAYVLSQCPAGGEHGTRGYGDWDAWVMAAVKTMLHTHRGIPIFAGYSAPSITVTNACVRTPRLAQTLSFGAAPTLVVGGTATVSAQASSGLPVQLATLPDAACRLENTLVTGLAAGLCVITADQGGDARYAPAPQALLSFTVSAAPLRPPGAPTIASITPGPGLAVVVLTPPVDMGGAAALSYQVTCEADGLVSVITTSTTTRVVVQGLRPRQAYRCSATASNGSFSSVPSSVGAVVAQPIDLSAIWMLLLD